MSETTSFLKMIQLLKVAQRSYRFVPPPPYDGFAIELARAIKHNTFLTTLKLILDPVWANAVVGEGGPIQLALEENEHITEVDLVGVPIPLLWSNYCRRNKARPISPVIVERGGRTVYAKQPQEIDDVLSRLARNVDDCNTVV